MSGSNNKSTTTRWTFGGRRRQAAQLPPPPQPPPPPPLSTFSTNSVADSAWASSDFMMGVGMVIIQQNTHKIVVVYERKLGYWFFPRGRKDIGETLEHAALREAYEESGYRASFLPLYHFTRQPAPPENLEAKNLPNTEPIFLTFKSWQPRKNAKGEFIDAGGEYLTTWYAGQIPEEAVKDTGTGMPDELHYESHLLTIEDALKCVWGQEVAVLRYVWSAYKDTLAWEARLHSQQNVEKSESAPASDVPQ